MPPVTGSKVALVLGAGAPHSPLMAGALYALYQQFQQFPGERRAQIFDIIYTSGAGALIGLLLAAPKNKKPDEALRSIIDFGISDAIYSLLPVNYKTFQKPGPFTRPIHQLAQLFKIGEFPIRPLENPQSPLGNWFNSVVGAGQAWRDVGDRGLTRLYNDLIDLWAAAITPTTLTFWSEGVCDPLPFLEDLVDFEELNRIPHDFYLNYFVPAEAVVAAEKARGRKPGAPESKASGTGAAMALFDKGRIRPEHVRAAFAYPFIYTPVKIDGKLAFEGANWEPISFGNLLSRRPRGINIAEVRTVVLVDIVSNLEPFLLREPRNLLDAYGLSIIWPVVANATRELRRLEGELQGAIHPVHRFALKKIVFEIDKESGANILDWSHSNMSRMFKIGVRAGEKFWSENKHELVRRS